MDRLEIFTALLQRSFGLSYAKPHKRKSVSVYIMYRMAKADGLEAVASPRHHVPSKVARRGFFFNRPRNGWLPARLVENFKVDDSVGLHLRSA